MCGPYPIFAPRLPAFLVSSRNVLETRSVVMVKWSELVIADSPCFVNCESRSCMSLSLSPGFFEQISSSEKDCPVAVARVSTTSLSGE